MNTRSVSQPLDHRSDREMLVVKAVVSFLICAAFCIPVRYLHEMKDCKHKK
jgi:DsbC/DsbD-like thiol-disulfide interchange protein